MKKPYEAMRVSTVGLISEVVQAGSVCGGNGQGNANGKSGDTPDGCSGLQGNRSGK